MKDTDVFIFGGSRFSVNVDARNEITHILDLFYLDSGNSVPITQNNIQTIREFLATISDFPYHIFVYGIDNNVVEFFEGVTNPSLVHNFRNELYRPFIWDMQGINRDCSPNPPTYTTVCNENVAYMDFKGYSLNYEIDERTGVVHVLDMTRPNRRPSEALEVPPICFELWTAIKEIYAQLTDIYIYTRKGTICIVFFDENLHPIRRFISMGSPDDKTSKDFVLDASYLTYKHIPSNILSALYPLSEGGDSDVRE